MLAVVVYFFGRALADNWDEVREIDLSVDAATVLAVLLFAAAVVLSGLLWGHMLERLGSVEVGRLEAVRVQCASWLLKYVPGQVGSVANKVLWAQARGISRTLVVITFVYENVFLLIGSIVPTAVILLIAMRGTAPGTSSSLVAPALALLPLLLVTNRRVFRGGINLVGRKALKRPVPEAYFLSGRSALGYQLAFLAPRVVNAVAFVLVATSFTDVPMSAYVPLGAAYVLAGAVGILAVFVPSGLGVREGVVVLFASQLMPVEQAVVLALLARFYSTIADGLIAVGYAALRGLERRGRS